MARLQFRELCSIKEIIFGTIEDNEINEKYSYLCDILIDIKKK